MDDRRFILAGSFFEGSGLGPKKNVLLGVENGIISSIRSASELPRDKSVPVDNYSHCIILPALIDCSISLMESPSLESNVHLAADKSCSNTWTSLLERHSLYCHTHGVLGVADSSNTKEVTLHYHEKATHGKIIELRTSHPQNTAAGEKTPGKKEDGSFLKIFYSNNIDDEKSPFFPVTKDDLFRKLNSRSDKKVVVANGIHKITDAVECGCDAIEQGYGIEEDILKKMAKNGVVWIPSLIRARNALDGAGSGGDVCCRFSQRYVAPGKPIPGAEAYWKKMLDNQIKQLRLAREIGVKTALGTGAGSAGILHGESMIEEMKLFMKAGYSLGETIQCASDNGASLFSMEKLGTLSVGKQATFLLARGSVQQLPRKLSYLEGIYVDGMPSRFYRKNPDFKIDNA